MEHNPSEVRRIILEQHVDLTRRMTGIEAALARWQHDDRAQTTGFVAALREFAQAFERHIEQEECILRPVLAVIDNWGPARLERMDEEHRAQRARMLALDRLRTRDAAAYVAEMRRLFRDLRVDMFAEERECLSPDVLRDDPVNIDAFSG
jgi:hypothetical protein